MTSTMLIAPGGTETGPGPSHTPPSPPGCLVVIAHYDAMPVDPLLALLKQIATVTAGAIFDTMVVVNRATVNGAALPELPMNCEIIYRENRGYNIGAWQHGWMMRKGYRYYLFLQDECSIERANWLSAFIKKAQTGYALVGESLVVLPRPPWHSPEFPEKLRRVLLEQGLNPTKDLTHVQTTIVFATGAALMRAGGFIEPGDEKVQAIACEVASSIRVRQLGYRIGQVAFLPFEYISHPQWADLRKRMSTPLGRLRRLLRTSLRS